MGAITVEEIEQTIDSLSNEDKKALRTKMFLDLNENTKMNLRVRNKTSMVFKSAKLLEASMGKKNIVNQKLLDLPPVESLVHPDPELVVLKEQAEIELAQELTQERKLAA